MLQVRKSESPQRMLLKIFFNESPSVAYGKPLATEGLSLTAASNI
jgi:hypothetical protein